jgi:hypothetical protein
MLFATSLLAIIANAMGDLGILVLLFPPTFRLQISFRKRAGIAGIFVGLAVIL